jgi:hypothetical protein
MTRGDHAMTTAPTPAADPRLAELTEALHSMTSKEHQKRHRYPRVCPQCQPRAEAIAALMPSFRALPPARTATTEAEALAAAMERLDRLNYFTVEKVNGSYAVDVNGRAFPSNGKTIPDAIAAALAATGGEE